MNDTITLTRQQVEELAVALLNDEDEAGGSGYGITGLAYGLLRDNLLDPLGIKLHVDATDDRFYIAADGPEEDEEMSEEEHVRHMLIGGHAIE